MIEDSEDYETPALYWLFGEAKRLDESLRRGAIADEATRRVITEDYIFGMGYALDADDERVTTGDGGTFKAVFVLQAEDGRLLRPRLRVPRSCDRGCR
jgi:hypothetical protein